MRATEGRDSIAKYTENPIGIQSLRSLVDLTRFTLDPIASRFFLPCLLHEVV